MKVSIFKMNRFALFVICMLLLPQPGQAQQRPTLLGEDPEEKGDPCDWKRAAGLLTDNELRLWIECYKDVDLNKGAAFTVFLDIDRDEKTGFEGPGETKAVGADYMIQGATLYRYDGSGTDWYWSEIKTGLGKADGKIWEIQIKLDLIGGKRNAVDLICFGDNEATGVGGRGLDLFPDGAFEGGDRLTLKIAPNL